MAQKFSILQIAALALTGTLSIACAVDDKGAEQPDSTPVCVQGFSMGTRADSDGDPEHGDTYTLISYRVGGTESTWVDKYRIMFHSDFGRQYGYYAYDDGVLSGRPPGTLVPVNAKAPNEGGTVPNYTPIEGISPLVKAPLEAMMVNSVPKDEADPENNQGVYRVAVIHPAIPMYSANSLGSMPVFLHGDEVFASMPDDANGDGVTDDPFEITVTHNDQVHSFPDPTELYPVKAEVKVWFYSEYYYDSDTLKEHPQEQTFDIVSLNMYNLGSSGWYNARTGVVYPNYNYGSTWSTNYSSTDTGLGTPAPNSHPYFRDLKNAVVVDGVTEGPGKAKHKFQYSVRTSVFPSDYRGYENGGLFEVQPLVLQMELDMDSGGQNKVSVPLAVEIKRGKRCHFYVNVLSEVIVVKYSVADWKTGGNSDDPIGGEMMDYIVVPLEYEPDDWDNVNSGHSEIGN